MELMGHSARAAMICLASSARRLSSHRSSLSPCPRAIGRVAMAGHAAGALWRRLRKAHLVLNRLYRSMDTAPAITKTTPTMISTTPSADRLEGGDDKGGELGDADGEGEGLGDADGDRECEGLGDGRAAHAAESTSI